MKSPPATSSSATKGATRSTATRTKEEGFRPRSGSARQGQGRGRRFRRLAKEYSDDPTAKAKGGDLGTFKKARWTRL